MTNCPNCGAVIDLTYDKCAYCGTPYRHAVLPLDPVQRVEVQGLPHLTQALVMGLVSPNEARTLMGLPVKE